MSDTVTLNREVVEQALRLLNAAFVNCDCGDVLKAALAAPQPDLPRPLPFVKITNFGCQCGRVYGFPTDMISTPQPEPQPVKQDDHAELVRNALRQAYNLGQTYWQQADSEYTSQHKKADATASKFKELCNQTVNELGAKP